MEELIKQGKKAAVVKKGKKERAKLVLPNIDPRFEFIKKSYDIHALSLRCNSVKCKKKVTKEALISESIVRSKQERDLAVLYLCVDHAKDMKKLEENLDKMTKGGMVQVTVSDRK